MAVTTPLPAPPAPALTRGQRLVAPTVVIGGLTVATLALCLRDPHQTGSWGLCPSAMLGIWCPGCGGLRAVNDLTHLRVLDAASSNVLLIAAMPVLVFLLGRWALDSWTGTERAAGWGSTRTVLVVCLTVLVLFTVLRNLPGFAWLAP